MPNMDLTDDEKIEHLHYLINSLLPFLKQIREEQMEEITMEAFVQGFYLKANGGNNLLISISLKAYIIKLR